MKRAVLITLALATFLCTTNVATAATYAIHTDELEVYDGEPDYPYATAPNGMESVAALDEGAPRPQQQRTHDVVAGTDDRWRPSAWRWAAILWRWAWALL